VVICLERGVTLCLQHVCRDAARRAGSSATADTCHTNTVVSFLALLMMENTTVHHRALMPL